MKAAVCYEFGKPLVIEDLDLAPPHSGEVKVRITAAAICHSDVHAIRGDWTGTLPVVVGHEAAGVVEELGEGVTTVKPGDRVVVSLLRSCGHCESCTTGISHMCMADFRLVTESPLRTRHGEVVRNGIRTAAFAEYAVVHQSQLVPIPAEMPFDRASLLACGVITGLGAVVNTAQVRPGNSVAVIGIGGVGINAVQGAMLSGAYPIIAVDVLEEKLQVAKQFGATHALNAGQPDLLDAVKTLTGGRGVDYAFVTVGSTHATEQALSLVKRRGTVVLVGIPHTGATFPVQMGVCVGSELRILGSFMGSTNLSVDVPRLVELYLNGRLKLDELITARYPLERINEAIEATETGTGLRNVILFD